MPNPVFFILFFAVLMPLVLAMTLPTCRTHASATTCVNHDDFMQKFIYKVPLREEEILHALTVRNAADALVCMLDRERSILHISEYGCELEFHFRISQCDGFSLLRLEQRSVIPKATLLHLKLNPFMIAKLNAEIVPFEEY